MNSRSTKRPNLNLLYSSPLPVKVKALPPLFLHNPLSWIQYISEYFFPEEVERIKCRAVIHESAGVSIVKVLAENDQDTLWSMGFFGKGTLSRSEPSWFTRTSRRLNLEGSDELPLTSEEITQVRRQERKKFKEERAKAEQKELENQKKLEKGEAIENAAEPVAPIRPSDIVKVDIESMKTGMRSEDADIVNDEGKLIQQEFMQLMPVETLFLSSALGVLDVYDDKGNLLEGHRLLEALANGDLKGFLNNYVVYHHFRSKGWCVKSGVKFGTDYLLYKRGPPFTHAEFAVMVVPTSKNEDENKKNCAEWWLASSIGRVVGGVKKTLVYSYVEISDVPEEFELESFLKASKVTDIVYRRWLPMKSRD